MGIKKDSKSFRDKLLSLNLRVLPEASTNPALSYILNSLQSKGFDPSFTYSNVKDAGSIDDHEVYREDLLKLNLGTPNDINDNLVNTFGTNTVSNWLFDRGTQTNINWFNVANTNPGSIDDSADEARKRLLLKNKTINPNDPSEDDNASIFVDRGYNYTSLLQTIGEPTSLNDFTVQNQESISNNLDLAEQFLTLNKNKYRPFEINVYDSRIKELENKLDSPYIVEETGALNNLQPNKYTADFLYRLENRQSIPNLLLGGERVLEDETILMNIAAEQIRFNIEARVKQNVLTETVGRVNLVNALTNPITAINLIKNPLDNFIDRDYVITDGDNILTRSARFLSGLAGFEYPISYIPIDTKPLTPSCFGDGEQSIQYTSKSNERNDTLLDYTGDGQKSALFDSVSYNKYTPNYSKLYESRFRRTIDGALEQIGNVTKYLGFGAGSPPDGTYYIGSKEYFEPISVFMDSDGDIVRGPDALIELYKNSGPRVLNNQLVSYTEPNTGSYRNLTGDLIWAIGNEDEVLYPPLNKPIKSDDRSKFSTNEAIFFRECSILDKTNKILQKGGPVSDSINQVKTTITNGSYTISKGSGVKGILTEENNAGLSARRYEVSDEYCRVWTKTKPYSKITDAIRYQDLIRKERNSVLDRYGNYNIFPSKLNVNEGYGDGETNTEFFGEKRARKYMFSIENLAWDGSSLYNTLPDCEKGPNGGRIMWFPPYNIDFTDDSFANYTKHNFLGRPEPVFTYNNTERTGMLKWSIVVDHPSILNFIIQKELANLTDQVFEDIIDAFWSGCVEFDIYELASIWGVFSVTELQKFKDIIDGIKKDESNDKIRRNKDVIDNGGKSDSDNTTVSEANVISAQLKSDLKKYSTFYQNDIPLASDDTSLLPFDNYYNTYKGLITTTGNKPLEESYDKTLSQDFNAALDPNNLKTGYDAQFKVLENKLKELASGSKGRSLTIDAFATASPLADGSYNQELATRRLISFGLWVAKVMGVSEIKNLKDADLYEQLVQGSGNDRFVKFHKPGSNGKLDEVIVKADTKNPREATIAETIDGFGGFPYEVEFDGKVVSCTEAKMSSRNGDDRICSILSPAASSVRAVRIANISDVLTPVDDVVESDEPQPLPTQDVINEDQLLDDTDVTKREIAQRILNRVISECDYFEYLAENTPTVYSSLKEKLKYFSPAFHSTTPEGLNSRLTFLQQCLRPGETIKQANGLNCDANNTAFGKPPVCVLRIGDFYHTKIIINTLNITYSEGNGPIWDLNPEGIGVQPMIANVQLTFNYIGGQGLRKPVDQLQTALSFNFYANADVYDSRTFANTDAKERALINQELDFFNNNELDLVSITESARFNNNTPNQTPESTIGEVLSVNNSETVVSGQTGLSDEYVNGFFNTAQISYKNVFSNLYTNYKDYLEKYIDLQNKSINKQFTDDYSRVFLGNSMLLNPYKIDFVPDYDNPAKTISNFDDKVRRLANYRNYHQVGVSTYNELDRVTNGASSTLNNRLYLYPQDELYKLSSGASGLTFPTNSLKTDVFNNTFAPKPINLNQHQDNINRLSQSFKNKTQQGLLLPLHRDYAANSAPNKWSGLLNPYKKVFKETVLSEFDNYLAQIVDEFESDVVYLNNKFNDVLFDISSISAVLSGYDFSVDTNNNITYYEVMPDANEIASSEIETYFTHKPYYEVRLLTWDDENSTTSSTNPVNTRLSNTSANISAITELTKLGSYSYFIKQITNEDGFEVNNLPLFDKTTLTWEQNTGQTLDNVNGTKSNIPSDYTMSKTFEKISYEFYEFSNKSSEVLLNDVTPYTESRFNGNMSITKSEFKNDSNQTLTQLLDADTYQHDEDQIRLLLLDSTKDINTVKFNVNNGNPYFTLYNYFNTLFKATYTVDDTTFESAKLRYQHSYEVSPTGTTSGLTTQISTIENNIQLKESQIAQKENQIFELENKTPVDLGAITNLRNEIAVLESEVLNLSIEVVSLNDELDNIQSGVNMELGAILPDSIKGIKTEFTSIEELVFLSFYKDVILSDDFKTKLTDAFNAVVITKTSIKNNPNKLSKAKNLSIEFINSFINNTNALVNDSVLNQHLKTIKSESETKINNLETLIDNLNLQVSSGESDYTLKMRETTSTDSTINSKLNNYYKLLKFSANTKIN